MRINEKMDLDIVKDTKKTQKKHSVESSFMGLSRQPVESVDTSLPSPPGKDLPPNIDPLLDDEKIPKPTEGTFPAYGEPYFTINEPTGPGPYITNVLEIEPSMRDWYHEKSPCHPFYIQFRMYQAKVLSSSCRKFLSMHLNPEVQMGLSAAGYQKDWQGLADVMGKNHQFTHNLARFKDPTGELLLTWQTENGSTIAKLISYLTQIDRFDILDDLQFMELIKNSCKDFDLQRERELRKIEAEKKAQEPPNLCVGDVNAEEKALFDAFVCFSDDDYEFMTEMMRELEEDAGYKLCLDVRDILEHDNHSITAEVIKERCKRTIVILSRNFVKEDNKLCEFAMRIAQSLSPAASRSKIIPILVDAHCTVPTSLRHLTLVNATRRFQRQFMWPKIKATLGDKTSQIYLVEQEKLRHVLLEPDIEGENMRDIVKKRHEESEAIKRAAEEASKSVSSSPSESLSSTNPSTSSSTSSSSSDGTVRIKVMPTSAAHVDSLSLNQEKGKKLSKKVRDGVKMFHWGSWKKKV